jgi:hypothetical protein
MSGAFNLYPALPTAELIFFSFATNRNILETDICNGFCPLVLPQFHCIRFSHRNSVCISLIPLPAYLTFLCLITQTTLCEGYKLGKIASDFSTKYNVMCRLKAGISESEQASIARQRLGSHVSATIRAVNASLSG